MKKAFFVLLSIVFGIQLFTGEDYDPNICREYKEQIESGRRGNWIDLQPGLFSIIDKIRTSKNPNLKVHFIVSPDTVFSGCMPLIFNLNVMKNEAGSVDTLAYNWHNDTICTFNFAYLGNDQDRRHIMGSMTWSSVDSIFLSNEILRRKEKMNIYPSDTIHMNLTGCSDRDKEVFDAVKNWTAEDLRREIYYFNERSRVSLLVVNNFMRIIIKNGKPIDAKSEMGRPMTINQLDWVDELNKTGRFPK